MYIHGVYFQLTSVFCFFEKDTLHPFSKKKKSVKSFSDKKGCIKINQQTGIEVCYRAPVHVSENC